MNSFQATLLWRWAVGSFLSSTSPLPSSDTGLHLAHTLTKESSAQWVTFHLWLSQYTAIAKTWNRSYRTWNNCFRVGTSHLWPSAAECYWTLTTPEVLFLQEVDHLGTFSVYVVGVSSRCENTHDVFSFLGQNEAYKTILWPTLEGHGPTQVTNSVHMADRHRLL